MTEYWVVWLSGRPGSDGYNRAYVRKFESLAKAQREKESIELEWGTTVMIVVDVTSLPRD